MVIVDTSIWIDHFRSGDDELVRLLTDLQVLAHPWIIGELTLGGLSADSTTLLSGLPAAEVATHDELIGVIRSRDLIGSGVGYVDAQLVASTLLTPDAKLWARERRLATVAKRLGVAHSPR